MILKTTADLAALLPGRHSLKGVKRLMGRLGVKPIDMGKGRGMGDWWILEEVQAAILLMRDGKPPVKVEAERMARRRSKLAEDYFALPFRKGEGASR